MSNHVDKRPAADVVPSLASEVVRDSFAQRRPSSASSSPAMSMFNSAGSAGVSYTLGSIGAGNPAITAPTTSQTASVTPQVRTDSFILYRFFCNL